MANERLLYLFDRFYEKSISPEEREELMLLMAGLEENDNSLNSLVDRYLLENKGNHEMDEKTAEILLQSIIRADTESEETSLRRRVPLWHNRFLKYAAAIIVLFGTGAYLWNKNSTNKITADMSAEARSAKEDVAPGGNKAILTLADGTTIILDSVAVGNIAEQGSSTIQKTANGQIVYSLSDKVLPVGPPSDSGISTERGSNPLSGGASSQSEEGVGNSLPEAGVGIPSGEGPLREAKRGVGLAPEAFNTMSTPRGGQYQLVLPDGTKVWLNAASSITYPVVFVGKERNVKITGEVYFEVVKDKSKPFFVTCSPLDEKAMYPPLAGEARRAGGGQVVEVLGTHFNINAYADEGNIKTTLLEGAVRIFSGVSSVGMKSRQSTGEGVDLKPGEQAISPAVSPAGVVSRHGDGKGIYVVRNADIENVIAWKNGFTQFKGADIKSIMNQVQRWYDIDVVYQGKIPERTFTGGVARSAKLSELLKILEISNIRFKLDGRKLIVIP